MGWGEDRQIGDYAVAFCNRLGMSSGEATPLHPWQEQVVRELLSTVDAATRKRRYKEAFIAIGKKNGKTRLVATLVTLFLLSSDKPNEIYSLAPTRDLAALVYKDVADLVRSTPELQGRLKLIDSKKRIVNYASGSFYQALSSDKKGGHGYRPYIVICDEPHAMPSRDLYDILKKSMATQSHSLFLTITHAGDDITGWAHDLWQYARKIQDGILDVPHFYARIWEAKPEDDWKDPATWRKANPALGDFLPYEAVAEECKQAIDLPSTLNSFLRYRLNIWTASEFAFLDMTRYDANQTPLDAEALKGQPCHVGIDLASAHDLSAVALVFPHEDGSYSVLPEFFIPADEATAWEARDGVPYLQWVREKRVIATPGNITDYRVIRDRINELAKSYSIQRIVIDKSDASQFSTELIADGYDVLRFAQSFASYSGPTKELERLVMSGKLKHGGHPVLRWNMSNVVAEVGQMGDIRPTKKKSKSKIDGAVATIMALGSAMDKANQAAAKTQSVYESRGLLIL